MTILKKIYNNIFSKLPALFHILNSHINDKGILITHHNYHHPSVNPVCGNKATNIKTQMTVVELFSQKK